MTFNFDGPEYMDPVLLDEPFYFNVDKSKYSQCIRNLISNSIKFNKAGGSVSVHTYLTAKIDESGLHREDTGFVIGRKDKQVHCVEMTEHGAAGSGNTLIGNDKGVLRIEVHDTGAGISEVNFCLGLLMVLLFSVLSHLLVSTMSPYAGWVALCRIIKRSCSKT